jgi:hypothetical protein
MSSHGQRLLYPVTKPPRREANSQRLSQLLQRAHYTNYQWNCQQFNDPYGVALHQATFTLAGTVISVSNLQRSKPKATEEAATVALPIVAATLRGWGLL